jgi:HK97 family phage prohead protease
MRLYGTIQKVNGEQRIVSGYASTEATDAHGEVVLKSALEAALDDYLDFSNLREMHQLSAVGTTEEATVDDKGLYISAKVVDDSAWKKVTTGVYKGFSIGGKVLARDSDDKKIITKIRLDEISLVDRPSNPEAKFDIYKAAGTSTGDDPFAKAMQAIDAANRKVSALTTDSASDLILKAFAAKDAEIEALKKRIDELLEEPQPRKTAGAHAFFAISKEDDAGGSAHLGKAEPSQDDLVAALQGMSEEDRALLLTTAALRLPRPATMVTTR